MTEYVAGFLIDRENDLVLLVEKLKPIWQSGLLNGIGGKVEDGETPHVAMDREFKEETKIEKNLQWRRFCTEIGRDYSVSFLVAFVDSMPWFPEYNDVGERLVAKVIKLILVSDVIGNLKWLIPLAMDWRQIVTEVHVEYADISERPTW